MTTTAVRTPRLIEILAAAPYGTTVRCTACPVPHDMRLLDVLVRLGRTDDDTWDAQLLCYGARPGDYDGPLCVALIPEGETEPWMDEVLDRAIHAIKPLAKPPRLTCGDATTITDWLADGRARGVPAEVLDLVRGTIDCRMSAGAGTRGGAA